MTYQPVPAWHEGRQALRNSHTVPTRFTRAHQPIPVTARLEWETDGVEVIDTIATAWTHTLALVDVPGPRWPHTSAWIPTDHITRR